MDAYIVHTILDLVASNRIEDNTALHQVPVRSKSSKTVNSIGRPHCRVEWWPFRLIWQRFAMTTAIYAEVALFRMSAHRLDIKVSTE